MSPLRIKLEYSQHFLNERKKYIKNNPDRFENYKKAITLFLANPLHPGLNNEKLKNAKGIPLANEFATGITIRKLIF